ncbi:hypothetical protein GUJ93_ZPchr0001g32838 [Zizania palustris]|uniref:Uncharacterized protein n=1 Tax=Zizania palustris TaxID=103762 RepID=A0A8J5R9L8_ZIZPA|nr:hypothetical protein GUJ93_ZPchr0001g32838 [Zizania palustris]
METSGERVLLPQAEPSTGSKSGGRGGWPAAFFLIVVGFAERAGLYGVESNLIMYLTGPLGMSTAAAAAGVNAWSGTAFMLPLLGALVADSWIGRYRAVVAAGVLFLLGLGMLTFSSIVPPFHLHKPAPCEDVAAICSSPASSGRVASFYVGLYLLAIAEGFYKPCSEALGADQFTDSTPGGLASRSSFFNWLHFSMSWGYAISAAGMSYLQENVGWSVGYGACWGVMLVSLFVFLLGTGTYRLEQPRRDVALLAGTFRETAKASTAGMFRRWDATDTESLLITPRGHRADKWVLVKLLPIWMASVVFAVVNSQVSTLFTKQGSTMDRRIRIGTGSGLIVPPAALLSFISLAQMVSIPVYDRVLVPLARRVAKHPSGITMLQRIGAGMSISCLAMVTAATVEAERLRVARDAGLLDQPDVAVPMSLWWMVPQYAMFGVACMLTIVGLEEFFYDQVPDELRSVGLAACMSINGVGSYVSGMLVSAIDWATTSGRESWFCNNLNRGHLDYFYWLLAGISAIQVLVFLYIARNYVYTNKQ